jgi:hypothetical protein
MIETKTDTQIDTHKGRKGKERRQARIDRLSHWQTKIDRHMERQIKK